MFPCVMGTRALLGASLYVLCLLVYLTTWVEGRKAKEELWPWEVPPGSCPCLGRASLGTFSNLQHTWEVTACGVILAASVLSRDGAGC